MMAGVTTFGRLGIGGGLAEAVAAGVAAGLGADDALVPVGLTDWTT